MEELRKFNSRRKLKGAVLAAVSSPRWQTSLQGLDVYNNDEEKPNVQNGNFHPF